MGLIITLSITSPQHNLFPWQMAAGTIAGTFFFLGAIWLWDRIPYERLKKSTTIYAALLILYGLSLYIISCVGRNSPDSLVDYMQIWNAASELSEGRALTSGSYFLNYSNNIKPMLYLSVLFRIAKYLRFNDPLYFVLFWSVCQVLAAAWGAGILSGNSKEERKKYRIPILLLFVCTLPVWANVQAFYTDSMSFMMGVVTLALVRLGLEAVSSRKTFFIMILSGIVAGIGISIKVTVFIPLLAGLIVFCFCRPSLKNRSYIITFFLSTIASLALTDLWAGSYELWNMAKETSDPAISWVALGLRGEGNYYDNRDFASYIHSLPTKKTKTEYTLEYIWENRNEFQNISHLIQKIRCNFASGHFGTKDFTYYSIKEHNPIWEIFSPWGKYYWRTSQLCFCYIFSLYSCYMLGAFSSIYHLLKRKELSAIKAIADLSLLGIIIFLMIWEANNRQLYNQLPMIILGALINARQLISLKNSLKR